MNKYLVTYEVEGKLLPPTIETSAEIFGKMQMDDCYDIRVANILWLKEYHTASEFEAATDKYPTCRFYGTWHNTADPLRMEIRMIGNSRATLDIGYAAEH